MSEHPLKSRGGFRRVIDAWGYSVQGLRAAWAFEAAFRQEVALAALMLPASWWLGENWAERVLLASTVVLVLIVELLKSAIEAVVDRISMDIHPLAGRAKDIGSAAVLLSLLLCGAVWVSALWPYFNGKWQ